MSEKEFKNNRPKSNEKDLEGLVQNFSQKLEPAAKKVKKTVGKIERQGMHAAEHYTGDDYTMRGAMVLATCGMAVKPSTSNIRYLKGNLILSGAVTRRPMQPWIFWIWKWEEKDKKKP